MNSMHIEQAKPTTPAVTVPPGRYFMGDPCYAVPQDLWMPLLESCGYFETSPVGHVAGLEVLAFATAWGDGSYYDQYSNAFLVDAGLIGLTPIELALRKADADELNTLGLVVDFEQPTLCHKHEGQLIFGRHIIET